MSKFTEKLLTPVGRLVRGSLYEPQTTDAENKPLINKTTGETRVSFYFGIAIPKGGEQHWSQTEWGAKIWEVGHKAFPAQAQSQHFAWKVTNGDSQEPNKAGRKPCDNDGYPGCWILNMSSAFAPSIHNSDGTQQILEVNAVNPGDYIQVYGSVSDNESQQQPGIYLNHSMVALAGYGQRIIFGADPKSVGFGGQPLPAGASVTPISQGFNPAPPAYSPPPVPPVAAPVYAAPPVSPHTAILTPPLPPAAPVATPQRVMLPGARGMAYEAFIAQGWTDALLIQHGKMAP
jgi:hypothetical protein